MPRMLNKDLTRSMRSLSREGQNRASERTASSSRFATWRRHIGKLEDPGDEVVSLWRLFSWPQVFILDHVTRNVLAVRNNEA